jgi:hypothetical protein
MTSRQSAPGRRAGPGTDYDLAFVTTELLCQLDLVFVLARSTSKTTTRIGDNAVNRACAGILQQTLIIRPWLCRACACTTVVIVIDVIYLYAVVLCHLSAVLALPGNIKLAAFTVAANTEIDTSY